MSANLHKKCYKAVQTVLEMLADRRYVVEKATLGIAGERNLELFSDGMHREKDIFFKAISRSKKRAAQHPPICVSIITCEEKVGVKTVRGIVERCQNQYGTQHLLIVYIENITPFAQKELKNSFPDISTEFFRLDELQYNITKHVIVPNFKVMKKSERLNLLQTVALRDLPRMLTTDPVSRYYNWKRGTIVFAECHSIRGHTYTEYRVIVV